jgi:hypothetical protein
MEMALVGHFGIRQNILVPNVSWGLKGLDHEVDLLLIRPGSGNAEEIEIKISASDLKRDETKNHGLGHVRSKLIRKLWFAVPLELAEHPSIPEDAGILVVVKDCRSQSKVIALRAPKLIQGSRPLTSDEIQAVLRLSNMRVWSLKAKNRLLSTRLKVSALLKAKAELA